MDRSSLPATTALPDTINFPAGLREAKTWDLLASAGGAVAGIVGLVLVNHVGLFSVAYAGAGLAIGAIQALQLSWQGYTKEQRSRIRLDWTLTTGLSAVLGWFLGGVLLYGPFYIATHVFWEHSRFMALWTDSLDAALVFVTSTFGSVFTISLTQHLLLRSSLSVAVRWMRSSLLGWLIAWGLAYATWRLPIGEYARVAAGGALGGLALGVMTRRAIVRGGVATGQGTVRPPSSDAT